MWMYSLLSYTLTAVVSRSPSFNMTMQPPWVPSRIAVPSLRILLAGLLLVASCLVPATEAFYLPGSAPRSFAPGDPVPLLVNALQPQISSKKRLQSLLPYDYYNPAFHFCRPGDGKTEPKKVSESLGSVLFGDRLYESPFEVSYSLVCRNGIFYTGGVSVQGAQLIMLSDCL